MTDTSHLRVPPHSIDSEQGVLGGLMLAPDRVDEIISKLSEDDFYRKDHRLIFRAMVEMSGRGQAIDAITMGEWLEVNNLAESVGGAGYIIKLSNNTPGAANILAYADIVREKAVRRRVIDKATELASQAFGSDSTGEDLLAQGIADLMAMQKLETRTEFTLRQAMSAAYAASKRAQESGELPGISSGLSKLDQVLGGWHNSDLIVIGARPSHGKTALLLNFALASNTECGIISAEQPADQIGARVMSIESKVESARMRNGKFEQEDLVNLRAAVVRLSNRTCMIYDRSAPTIADVQRIARKWKHQTKIKMLLVDYVQRIEVTDRKLPRHERVAEVVRGLKNLARDLDIPVIALSQVNRQVEARADKRPSMHDLSDSSDIEKEADQVITLYREGVYDPDSEYARTAELSVEKNRHGPTGFIRVAWLAETMRFRDLAQDIPHAA